MTVCASCRRLDSFRQAIRCNGGDIKLQTGYRRSSERDGRGAREGMGETVANQTQSPSNTDEDRAATVMPRCSVSFLCPASVEEAGSYVASGL